MLLLLFLIIFSLICDILNETLVFGAFGLFLTGIYAFNLFSLMIIALSVLLLNILQNIVKI